VESKVRTLEDHVVVAEQQQLAAGQPRPSIPRAGCPAMGLSVEHQFDPVPAETPHDPGGFVVRAVVDDDHLVAIGSVIQAHDCRESFLEHVWSAKRRYDNRERRIGPAHVD
jgi:hypothetical protein